LIEQHGAPPVLGEHADPKPSAGCAIIAVKAAPIIPLDLLCATGTSYFGAQPLPYVPGVQGVGVVTRGSTVPEGSRVWFPTTAGMRPGDGSMAELALAPEAELVMLPDDVGDSVVAALGLSAVAAWMALTWRARMQPGEQVLVLGAGGVVGQVAVQAAKRLGARRVVAACRSEDAQKRAAGCGADAVVPLYDEDDVPSLTTRLAEACDGPLDVVVDPLFGVPASAAAQLLGSRGRLVNLGSSAGETAVFHSAHLRSHTAAVLGYTNNDITVAERRQALLDVLRQVAETGLTVGHEVVPLQDVSAAWSNQASGVARQRIVVQVG
jgi:NADPH:quinone reductase-like Zn-dependent oxidoreductase